jgi:hypothetical protein
MESQLQQQQAAESSSWFRFGSRKSRYPQQHEREPMTSVAESDEPEEPPQAFEIPEPLEQHTTEEQQQLPSEYEPPKYFESQVSKGKSSWFGFRRSKSPGDLRRVLKSIENVTDDLPVEDIALEGAPEASELSPSSDNSPLPVLPDVTPSPEALFSSTSPKMESAEKQSSWFSFRRSKSPGAFKEPNFQEDMLSLGQATQPTESSETDDDWLQEVMNPHDNKENEVETDALESEMFVEEEGLPVLYGNSEPKLKSPWVQFNFLSRSSPRDVSRLPSAVTEEEERGGCVEQPALSKSSLGEAAINGWFEEVVTRPIDMACLGPAWYGQVEALPESPPVTIPPYGEDNIDYDGFFSRSRLGTESSIPTVATEDEEEDFSQEFVQGMENNLSFLNF